jgi:hypothetical protein
MGMIRNISQTAQEREIVKLAPDLVVYIEGNPYLKNEFLATSPDSPATLVNFNDHVTSFNASYAVDNFVPQCSITLSVPNHLKYLYQVPGGTNIIQTMMQIQVYAKGRFLANNGNTLYRRVFKGLISHISFQDDGKSLQISVQCQGILYFLSLMRIDLHPAIQTSSQFDATTMSTVFGNLNPYQLIAAVFLTSIYTDGFQLPTVAGTATNNTSSNYKTEQNSPYFKAISEGFISKWQAISKGIGQDVHIYGLTEKELALTQGTVAALSNLTKRSPAQGTQDINLAAMKSAYLGSLTESDSLGLVDYTAIRQHMPEMSIDDVQLLNGEVVNRLDRLRTVTNALLYEGYQDVDGQVIFKPPMYNLDVTNLGMATSDAAKKFQQFPSTDINTHNNPFVITLAEIKTEEETEDQAGVHATRVIIQGTWSTQLQVKTLGADKLAFAEYVDLAKLAQFGLREEPVTPINWLQGGDTLGLFAYAASALVRANRGYRTYTVTIPMRPELKLGFPCFIPHKDMYGYINNISINYQMGGDATMTVSMDTLRKRPMFPRPQSNSNNTTGSGVQQTTGGVIYATQPNLIYQWTTPNNVSTSLQTTASQTPLPPTLTSSATPVEAINPRIPPPPPGSGTIADPSSSGSSVGDFGTITKSVDDTTTTNDSIKVVNYRQAAGANYFTMKSDTKSTCWNVQNDPGPIQGGQVTSGIVGPSGTVLTPSSGSSTSSYGGFIQPRIVDNSYYTDIFTGHMPYTDAKGYEVVAPFPWGRYTDLKTALWDFTQLGYVTATAASNEDTLTLQNIDSFLFAGLETPSASGSTSASDLNAALLSQLTTQAGNPTQSPTIIELSYTSTSTSTTQTNDATLLTNPQPDNNNPLDNQLTQNTLSSGAAAVAVFVSGTTNTSGTILEDAQAIKNNPTETGVPITS